MAPTPESEAFLAKKPKVPPTFDGVDYDDTPRLKQAQDAIIREQWVRSMMARLVREELGKCYYREGVNHLEKCGALRGKLSCVGVRGWKSRPWNCLVMARNQGLGILWLYTDD
jgi:large subunit ribosomal protein L54